MVSKNVEVRTSCISCYTIYFLFRFFFLFAFFPSGRFFLLLPFFFLLAFLSIVFAAIARFATTTVLVRPAYGGSVAISNPPLAECASFAALSAMQHSWINWNRLSSDS